MKNPLAFVNKNKAVASAIKTAGEFYILHQSTVLTVGTIGCSIATTALTFKNANYILETLRVAKVMLEDESNADKKGAIYTATLKELAPKVIPIIIFQTLTILCALENKKQSDKKIADMTSALMLAQNAISQYQVFNERAETELGEKKAAKLRKEIAQERVDETPITTNNLTPVTAAGQIFTYYDTFGNRYIQSSKSPADIEQFCFEMSKDLYDGNCDGDRVTVNEIYTFINSDVSTPSGDDFGWLSEDSRGQRSSNLISLYITPAEMSDHKTLCYELDLQARPLFRTRY